MDCHISWFCLCLANESVSPSSSASSVPAVFRWRCTPLLADWAKQLVWKHFSIYKCLGKGGQVPIIENKEFSRWEFLFQQQTIYIKYSVIMKWYCQINNVITYFKGQWAAYHQCWWMTPAFLTPSNHSHSIIQPYRWWYSLPFQTNLSSSEPSTPGHRVSSSGSSKYKEPIPLLTEPITPPGEPLLHFIKSFYITGLATRINIKI